MKIKVRYDNRVTELEVSEEEFAVMIDIDYQEQLENEEDKSKIHCRTPQEVVDEQLNKPEYNSFHKFDRHRDKYKKYPADDGTEEVTDKMDTYGNWSEEKKRDEKFSHDALCERIRAAMKPEQAELIIAICIDGFTPQEYAAKVGDKANNVSHRLQRAKENFRKIFPRASF